MEQQATLNKDAPNTKEMVRKLEETAGVANATLENLHIQGEQMNRVIDMNDTHSDQLFTAERLTRQLSFTGRISNLFRKTHKYHKSKVQAKPQMSSENPDQAWAPTTAKANEPKEKKKGKKEKEEEELSPEDRIWKERSDPNYKPPPPPPQVEGLPSDLTVSQLHMIQEEDRDLDQMSNILSSLKEMAQITNVELQQHSAKIDVMDNQIEKNLNSTRKTTATLSSKYGY